MPFSEILCRIFAHFPDITSKQPVKGDKTMQKLFTLTFVCLFLTVQMAEGQLRRAQQQQPQQQRVQQSNTRDARLSAIAPAPGMSTPPAAQRPAPVAPNIGSKSGPVPETGLTYADGKTHVLLIGVNNYPMPEPRVEGREHLQSVSFSTLRFCVKDMEELKKALVQARFCNEADVQLLVSGAGGSNEPTKANVDSAFQALLNKIGPGDRVLVAFSGHGIALPSEERAGTSEDFLACTDAKVIYDDSPLVRRFTTRDGIVSRARLEEALDASQAGPKLVFIDACRNVLDVAAETAGNDSSTRGIKGLSQFGEVSGILSDIKNKSGLFRLSSCLPGEVSQEHRELGHGVFTYFIIKGLQGAAPQRSPGRITLDDLYSYVRRETREYVAQIPNTDTSQNPSMFALPNIEGRTLSEDIVLAYYAGTQEQDNTALLQAERQRRDEAVREQSDYERLLADHQRLLAAQQPQNNPVSGTSTPVRNNVPQQPNTAETALLRQQADNASQQVSRANANISQIQRGYGGGGGTGRNPSPR